MKEGVTKRIEKEIAEFEKMVAASFNEKDAEKILIALDLMLKLHSGQKDRIDGRPYAVHPLEVAYDIVVKFHIYDPELVIAALLHDTVEDQSKKILRLYSSTPNAVFSDEEERQQAALDALENICGKRIRTILAGLTNPDFKKHLRERGIDDVEKGMIALYKEHVAEAINDPDVFAVKLSDLMRNIGNIPKNGTKRNHFIKKYGQTVIEIILPAFEGMGEAHPLYAIKDEILKDLRALSNGILAVRYQNDTINK